MGFYLRSPARNVLKPARAGGLDSRLLLPSFCFAMSSFSGKGEKTKGKGGGKGSKTKGAGNDAQKVLVFGSNFSSTL